MPDPTPTPPLAPDAASRLAEFSRVCKAAARAVSLYPGGHPAIGVSLTRLEQATTKLTDAGPYKVQVLSDGLLIDGARMAKPDPAVSELAALLHRHLIGRLTVNAGANAESWRTLLLLLARSPEEVRADGGMAKLWTTAGGPSLEIGEIDYAEVLREKQGLAATIDSIIEAAMSGPTLTVDDAAMRAVVDIIKDPGKLEQLMQTLETTAARSPQGVELQTAALLNIVRGLVDYVGRTDPQQLNTVFEQFGRGARHLSVEAMIALLAERKRPEAMAGSVNVVSALIESMSDGSVAGFVADAVVAERGASERLAHAFRALVPEFDRQRQLLALAREEVASSEMAREQDPEEFKGLWNGVEQMLTSYTDARYVSEDYARELSHARTLPVDVERVSDDPPERIAAWLSTVSDAALRSLDQDLLTDLLHIETDPSRWRDVADTVVTHADDLVRVGHFDQAWLLIETLIEQGDPEPLPQAARRRGARPLRARFADEARRAAPAFGRRRAVRAIQARVPRDRAVDHRAARRGARRRAGRARAQAPARSPGRLRPARRRGGAAAAQRAELGGSAHGSLPLARVRRRRGPQGAGPAPRRLRTPGTA